MAGAAAFRARGLSLSLSLSLTKKDAKTTSCSCASEKVYRLCLVAVERQTLKLNSPSEEFVKLATSHVLTVSDGRRNSRRGLVFKFQTTGEGSSFHDTKQEWIGSLCRWLTSWAIFTKVYRGNFRAPCSS